jgi:RNA polymerase sigma-70 factor, ECF subfamily
MELILEHCPQEHAGEAAQTDTDAALPTPLLDVFLKELPLLKCIIAGMGFGRRDAEDVIQDVSVQVLKHPLESRSRRAAVAWLKRVTVNKCISEYRRRERFQRRVPTMFRRQQVMDSPVLGPEGEMMQKEQMDMLKQALRNLDDSLLMPLILRFFCDHNASEIAEILNMKASTVRSRLRKARMLLADTLMKGK